MSEPGMKKLAASGHGGGVRGDTMRRRSSMFEGRFGRMFRDLAPASWPEGALRALGDAMLALPEATDTTPKLPTASPETDAILQDDEENSGISSGYTYLGQFIDHDLTFDPASSLQQQNDPDGLVDFRTPRLDLDSVYGRGRDDQPYLYDGNRFRLGLPLFELDQASPRRDLPRYDDPEDPSRAKRALIGDPRNDENVIVSQLHSTMLQFHNRLADLNPSLAFTEVQQLVRWHYQWIVVNDFLVRICGEEVVDEILPYRKEAKPAWEKEPKLQFYKPRQTAFMPIEFSAAAYRFGHSMVRPIYRLNTQLHGGDNPEMATPDEINRGLQGRFFIFAGVQSRGLNGFDAFPKQWGIDWSLFFDIDGSGEKGGIWRAQPAYKIDTSLVNPLGFLPEFSAVARASPPLTVEQLQAKPLDAVRNPANLATRNLLRGMSMELPSGQAVADAMGVPRVLDEQLFVGKAIVGELTKGPRLVDLDPSFAGNAPLWYYVLAEAQHEWLARATGPGGKGNAEPVRLGAVGRRIVAETLIGVLAADGRSYLRQNPNWQPVIAGQPIRTMGTLLKFASG
jgi:hypothetical protein